MYKTEDFGKTWKSLRANLPGTGYLNVIREDPVNENLLYLGSEFGLFFSFNKGKKWTPLKNGFPTVAVRDIQVHPEANDLIIGTHGRGVWIIDDIGPLQQLKKEIFAAPVVLINIRPATLHLLKSSSNLHSTPAFSAPNTPFGAVINYYLNTKLTKDEKVLLYIYNAKGEKIRTLEGTPAMGLNRVYWDLRGGPLPEQIYVLQLEISNYLGAPAETQKQRIKEISAKVLSLLQRVRELISSDIPQLNRLLLENKIEYIHVPKISQME